MMMGRVMPTLIPYEETLLAAARTLITNGELSIAVVVAHMACEIGAERAIARAFAAKGVGYLEEPVFAYSSGYNSHCSTLCNPATR